MTRKAAAATAAPAAGSPQKKKKKTSPKKVGFGFSFKNYLVRLRSGHAKLPRDGVSPINTLRRTGRSMSEPARRVDRTRAFEDDDEGIAGDVRESGGSAQAQEVASTQRAMAPHGAPGGSGHEHGDEALVLLEEPVQEVLCDRQRADDVAEYAATGILQLDEDELITDEPAEALPALLCEYQYDAVDVYHGVDHPQLPPYDNSLSHSDWTVLMADERAHKRLCKLHPLHTEQHSGHVDDASLSSEPRDEYEQKETSHDDLADNSVDQVVGEDTTVPGKGFHEGSVPDTEPVESVREVDLSTVVSNHIRVDEADLGRIVLEESDVEVGEACSGESERSYPNLKLRHSGRECGEMITEMSKRRMPLSRIDEEDGSEEGDDTLGEERSDGGESIQLLDFGNQVEEVIPATTTHRIRVGVLPGSPIHTPLRLMSIFEDDEEKSEDNNQFQTINEHETFPPGDQQFSSGTESTISTNDEDRSVQHQDRFKVIHEADAVDEPMEIRFGSSSTPDFSPTSPVQVVEPSDTVSWHTARSRDAISLHDDGASTWTNFSGGEADSEIEALLETVDAEVYVEMGGHTDSILSSEELVEELDQAGERLTTTIIVVGEAIDLASELLGEAASESEGVDAQVQTPLSPISRMGGSGVTTAVDTSADGESEASEHAVLFSDEESMPSVTAHPEEEDQQARVELRDTGDSPSSDELNGDEESSGVDRVGTALPFTFAEIYGYEDFRSRNETPTEGELGRDLDRLAFVPSTCNRCSTDPSVPPPESRISTDPDLEECEGGRSRLAFMIWMLAVIGAVLFGVTLFDLPAPDSPRGEQITLNASTTCKEVWDSIAETEQKSHVHARPATVPAPTIPEHALPSLLESDIMSACELVFDMLTTGELVNAELGLAAEPEDEPRNEPQVDVDQATPTSSIQGGYFLLSLAVTLLVVAFLQYDSRV